MIRGKKNFLPQTALVFGFGLLYKVTFFFIIAGKICSQKIGMHFENHFRMIYS